MTHERPRRRKRSLMEDERGWEKRREDGTVREGKETRYEKGRGCDTKRERGTIRESRRQVWRERETERKRQRDGERERGNERQNVFWYLLFVVMIDLIDIERYAEHKLGSGKHNKSRYSLRR
jgi:hypothetical protein